MATTVIKNADWVIAWQPQPGRHVYMRGVDVAFDGSTFTHVGKDYLGPADRIVDGQDEDVLPVRFEHGRSGKMPRARMLLQLKKFNRSYY